MTNDTAAAGQLPQKANAAAEQRRAASGFRIPPIRRVERRRFRRPPVPAAAAPRHQVRRIVF